MKTIEIETCSREQFALIGDLHLGRLDVDMDSLQTAIDYIAEHEIGWIGMGDYVEGREPSHKFFEPYETTMMVQEQYDYLFNLLKPIAHKCLGMLIGNHEDSLIRRTTLNPIKQFCEANYIPYLGSLGRLVFNQEATGDRAILYVTHGDGDGGRHGGKINKLIDWAVRRDCDGLACGHFHTLGDWTETVEEGGVRKYKTVMICGTFMDSLHETAESYAVRKMMSPVPIGFMTFSVAFDDVSPRKIIPHPVFLG